MSINTSMQTLSPASLSITSTESSWLVLCPTLGSSAQGLGCPSPSCSFLYNLNHLTTGPLPFPHPPLLTWPSSVCWSRSLWTHPNASITACALPYTYNKNINPLGAVVSSFYFFFSFKRKLRSLRLPVSDLSSRSQPPTLLGPSAVSFLFLYFLCRFQFFTWVCFPFVSGSASFSCLVLSRV